MAALENWMGKLPETLLNTPLLNLVMPGSHDSFSSQLDADGPAANDTPQWLRNLANGCGAAKQVLYKWSVTQRWQIDEQLRRGVRYLDVRVSRPDDGGDVRLVHGLYGEPVAELFLSALEFLGEHPDEALLVDMNHFYNFDEQTHGQLIALVVAMFDVNLCPRADPLSVTLASLRERGQQVVLFYQTDAAVDIPACLWTRQQIRSPWADTDNAAQLVAFLERQLAERASRPAGFFVTQGVLTPRTCDVIMHCGGGSLETDMADATTRAVVQWLRERAAALRPALNIVLCDFVEKYDFCQAVVDINFA